MFAKLKLLMLLILCSLAAVWVVPAFADRATHWDQYQASRDPYMELALFFLGAVAAIGVLYALSKITERK